jgi:hypothetical protein
MDPFADASEAKRPERKGRKPDVGKNNVDLIPFEEFAKSLKGDWVRLTHRKFSFEAVQAEWRRPIDREPTSAEVLEWMKTQVAQSRGYSRPALNISIPSSVKGQGDV